MKIAVIIVVILAILGGGAAVLSKNNPKINNQPTTTSTPASSNLSTNTNPSANTDQTGATTITYSNNGFSPSTLTVKAGTIITIKNTSSRLMQFDSDPHPAHTDDPELNAGSIVPGDSKTITVTVTGSHGYHNHLNPSDTGTLIVQ